VDFRTLFSLRSTFYAALARTSISVLTIFRYRISIHPTQVCRTELELSIARQIAAIVLALWRSMEVYDPKRLEESHHGVEARHEGERRSDTREAESAGRATRAGHAGQ